MAGDILTLEQIADWIPPSQAVKILEAVYEDRSLAKATLLERLRGGMVRAVAAETVIESSRSHRTVNVQIPAAHWKNVDTGDSVWRTGDLTYHFIDDHSAYRSNATARHYNLRFDPDAVHAIIAPLLKSAPKPVDALADAGQTVSKGPDVSPAHLRAWYDLYKSTYPDDSEDHAWTSARGMFHDKTVTRGKIRKLRGEREMGRPKDKKS